MIPLVLAACLVAADPLAAARGHLNHGRYDEALDAFEAVVDPAAALGTSRIRIETGRYDEAAKTLDAAIAASPDNPDLLARRGELRLLRGDLVGADADADAAIKLASEHLAARWTKAEVLTETGRIAEAADACRWFVRYYNRVQPTDADSLVTIADGSLRYARWKRVPSVFRFVINDLCPDAAKAAPEDWRPDFVSGRLLLEKYNAAQGRPDLKRALAKNPHAAAVHAALARAAADDGDLDAADKAAGAALAVNPNSISALGVKADLAFADEDRAAARRFIDAALAVDPHDQETLGRKAAILILDADGTSRLDAVLAAVRTGKVASLGKTPLETLAADLLARNPKPGAFVFRLGATLEDRRRYAEATACYEAAVAVMPELPEPATSLALLGMRSGDVTTAGPMLDAAFKADPFNVRVSNMRKVVTLLKGYETVETPHFVVRFDPQRDRVLAELMAEHLEDSYAGVTGEFGFEPPGKTTVELFNDGDGESGHGWFAARMVGLPWVQTIGASTGAMIALASPTAGQSYHWGRVVKHEFVHVVTLQQTEYRIPHWYTEALAVRSEESPLSDEWKTLLRERVPAGTIRSLDELNAAFVRPESPADWQFAYCQSVLYARYLDATFGPAVHRRLLDGYTRGLATPAAIAAACDQPAATFDAGYRAFLKQTVADLGPGDSSEDDDVPPDELRKQAAAAPGDAVLAGRLAAKLLGAGKKTEARQAAERAATLDATNSDAAVVLAQLAITSGQPAAAMEQLTFALDRRKPHAELLKLLGRLKVAAGSPGEAADLFALGRKAFPQDGGWLKLETAALLKAGKTEGLKAVLEQLAAADPDDGLAAKKLAEIAAVAGDAAAAKRWSLRALFVTPNDAAVHRLLADACDKLGEKDRAATARRHAEIAEAAE